MDKGMHKVLQRQLNRLNLTVDNLPTELNQWKDFVEKVNKSYIDADEERYLIERSMELSSKEILELNEKLENAQHIAGIGHWHYDVENGIIIWSNELRQIMQVNPEDNIPKFQDLLEFIHPNDRDRIECLVKQASNEGVKYETEIQMKSFQTDQYIWLYVVGAPYQNDKLPATQLAGVCMDITKRKTAELEIDKLHQELISSARTVGMADVAVSILHNVGNVLNSANVSINLLNEQRKKNHYKRLFDILDMFQEHKESIYEYLTKDEKGKLIPEYLCKLSEVLKQGYEMEVEEMKNLTEHIQHIRAIVAAQQSISQGGSLKVKVDLQEAMDTALKMVGTQISERGISVKKEYDVNYSLFIDRAKLLQILVNLIQNAKDAIIFDANKNKEKNITLSITEYVDYEGEYIDLKVTDSGFGISADKINKIFTFGYTTKNNGHGIGLHSSILAAKEMGINLNVTSDGEDKGATFCVRILKEKII